MSRVLYRVHNRHDLIHHLFYLTGITTTATTTATLIHLLLNILLDSSLLILMVVCTTTTASVTRSFSMDRTMFAAGSLFSLSAFSAGFCTFSCCTGSCTAAF